MYVRRCNICAACAKRRQRSEEGGRPRRVSPSCLLPRLRRSEASPPIPGLPAFPVSSLPLLRSPLTPRPPGNRVSEGGCGRKRDGQTERERENPRPFTDLLAVAAVSYLGLRGAPLYRRTATLGSPPHLLYSVSYPLFPTWPHRSLARSPFRCRSLARAALLPPVRASRVRLSGFLSGTFASPTSVTRDCRDSEDIVAVGGLRQLSPAATAAVRGLRAGADQRVIEMSVGELEGPPPPPLPRLIISSVLGGD